MQSVIFLIYLLSSLILLICSQSAQHYCDKNTGECSAFEFESFKNGNFDGISYRLANNWYEFIPLIEFKNKPINYLEIGCLYGGNILSITESYGLHDNSKLTCIDPWIDYEDYDEYKGEQNIIYNKFLNNIKPKNDKIIIYRGFSNIELLKLNDNQYDIIYIDGNHEPEYVMEDAILSFRKLKINGYMIFDDYSMIGPIQTAKGIDGFVHGYNNKIEILGTKDNQLFIKKIA